tara:strand:- start:613 stop:912 length:300 start_codon:yes stop_codon:yes gene_type:complete
VKSKKIRNSARGEDCQVRIPGICNFNPETTIPAHIGHGGGTGMKASDLEIAYCCSDCHDLIDQRTNIAEFSDLEIKLMAYEGAARTREILVSKSLIEVK